jgi:uncharacterized protein (TIGR03066 family)
MPAGPAIAGGTSMFVPRLAGVVLLVALPTVATAQGAAALAGPRAWTVVKSEEAPPGTRIVFGADGKLTLTFVIEGKPREVSGTYAVSGNQLTLKLNHDGKERVETRTIKKLTDAVLVTEDKNRKVEELERR